MVQLCVNLFYEKLINIFLRFKNLNYFELHSGELFAQLRKYKKTFNYVEEILRENLFNVSYVVCNFL